jgi:predicted DNA-binding protein
MLAMPTRKPPAVVPDRQVNFRLPQELSEWLAAAGAVLGRPQGWIVTEALQQYRHALSGADQKLVEQALARRRKS